MSTTILPTHRCFDDALDFIDSLLMEKKREAQRAVLVHAICHPTGGNAFPKIERLAHAWVELDGMAIFAGILMGKRQYFEVTASDYYIDLRPSYIRKYTVGEALTMNLQEKHYGPWDPKIREAL